MKLEIKKSTPQALEFVLQGATFAFANAIRRTSMSYIPVYAIDSIVVYENTSSFFDEYLANRLGLIPLTTPSDARQEDEILLSLDAEGPGVVYSKDIKSSEKDVKPASDKILIAKLLQGQRLRLEAKARLGTSRQHAKFQSGIAAYDYDEKKESFNFKIESFGQMTPVALLEKSIDLLQSKCEELLTALSEK